MQAKLINLIPTATINFLRNSCGYTDNLPVNYLRNLKIWLFTDAQGINYILDKINNEWFLIPAYNPPGSYYSVKLIQNPHNTKEQVELAYAASCVPRTTEYKLPASYIATLLTYPESGMGYQTVNIELQNGLILENIQVLNAAIALLNAVDIYLIQAYGIACIDYKE